VKDILPLLEKILQVTKAPRDHRDDVDGEALATLVVNKLRGTINILAVKAPGFGDRRKAMLEDIAILTGGRSSPRTSASSSRNATVADLGRAKRIVSTRTTPRSSKAGKRRPSRPGSSQIKQAQIEDDHERLRPREAPGAPRQAGRRRRRHQRRRRTEVELKEKKARVEDALSATRAAVEEGIVPGGGVALIY
jgi:chaperonin GroEL